MSRHRVVILSPGGAFVQAMIEELRRRGTPVDALVLYPPQSKGRARLIRPFLWLAHALKLALRARRGGAAARVVLTGPLNGAWMERDLRRLAPDVVVLAHCLIVAPHILQIARDGVLNVHPGLLPWVRGSNPFGNALLRSVPLGCTSFWVDPGIDTGAMIERRLLPVAGSETQRELRDALFGLWVEMTAGLVAAALAGEEIPRAPQPPERFPLCRALAAPDEQAAVAAAVAVGNARTLFERWRTLCPAGTLSLPVDAQAAFLPRSAG
jgi:methionyl-tRNA formyltransferase